MNRLSAYAWAACLALAIFATLNVSRVIDEKADEAVRYEARLKAKDREIALYKRQPEFICKQYAVAMQLHGITHCYRTVTKL